MAGFLVWGFTDIAALFLGLLDASMLEAKGTF